jgi:hypothetical protein
VKKNGGNGKSITESEVVQRLQRYRKRLMEEMGYTHWNEDAKTAFKAALKWFDKCVLNRE